MTKNINILWVDDDRQTTELWAPAFNKFGFAVTAAQSVKEALELMKRSTFDLLLVDLQLETHSHHAATNANGIHLIEKVRKHDSRIPIFVLSAYIGSEEYRGHLDRFALHGLIRKPLPVERSELEGLMLKMELACKEADFARLQDKYGDISVKDVIGRFTKGRKCFVLMPFRKEFDAIYEDVVQPLLRNNGIDCRRADEIYGVADVMDDILAGIAEADFLIAELTSRNPNVFYELGLAHAFNKPVILMVQDIESVPFDLKQRRCIVYTADHRGVGKLQVDLERTVHAVVMALPDAR
jgi:CheY-like chemotaxis protein